ncbi:MAG: thioredoxin family protein [Candidatus Bathyarchaeota archaeon]|nr:thioredoxin family protein [Candidatus Bathyarchaeota archaeon]
MNQKEDDGDVERQWNSKERAYVLFYASWCPHSQRFLPVFEEYSKANPDECVEVMIDYRSDLCDKYGIEYYPTVLLFKKGKVQKRLDAKPGLGLTREQLYELAASPS